MVYDEDRLKDIFIEGLQEQIRHSARKYWGKNPEEDLQELARHAKSMEILRGDNPLADPFDKPPKGR